MRWIVTSLARFAASLLFRRIEMADLHRLPRDRPVLLISGERDNYVPPSIIRGIARKIGSPQCRIWSVPKAKHNQARTVAREDYDQALDDFFSAVCPAIQAVPTPPAVVEVG